MSQANDLLKDILEKLASVEIQEKTLQKEELLEYFLLSELKGIISKFDTSITNQPTAYNDRKQKVDISIGLGEILIEIKILESINDLYRLFYQVIKYLKIAKKTLILFIVDRNDILKPEDKEDLKSLVKAPKTLKIIRRLR
jgi:hypothetical protein